MMNLDRFIDRQWTPDYDCYAFVRDVYLDLCGFVLTDYARPALWWAHHPELDLISASFQAEGFRPLHVRPHQMQPGDGLLIALGGRTINHLGVHIGQGRFIHLPFRSRSRIDLFGGSWMDRTLLTVRNPAIHVADTRPTVDALDLLSPERQERYRAIAAGLPSHPLSQQSK